MYYYLNQNFYGNQSYGVAAAAKSYFGVTDLKKLTLAQAAILAAIPQSPTAYDLVKNADQQTDAKGNPILVVPNNTPIVQRRNQVLEAMRKYRVLTALDKPGAITDAQITAAEKEPVILAGQTTPNWRAPHFVWQVRKQLGEYLCPQDPDNCARIDTGGYKIITTLDWNMQKIAEKWVQAAVLAPNAKSTSAELKRLKVPDRGVDPEPARQEHPQRRAGRGRLPDRQHPGLRRQRLLLQPDQDQAVPAAVRRARRRLAPARLGDEAHQLHHGLRGRHDHAGHDVHGRHD